MTVPRSAQPRRGVPAQAVFNRLVRWLLYSPAHRLLSNHLMVLSYTGVKSGRVRHVPLTYLASGTQIIAFCNRDVTWWKNLRGGARVTLRLRGQTHQAIARLVTDDATRMAPAFLAFLRKNRQAGGFNAVPFDATGEPDQEALAQILPTKVMIQMELPETRTMIAR